MQVAEAAYLLLDPGLLSNSQYILQFDFAVKLGRYFEIYSKTNSWFPTLSHSSRLHYLAFKIVMQRKLRYRENSDNSDAEFSLKYFVLCTLPNITNAKEKFPSCFNFVGFLVPVSFKRTLHMAE